MDNQTPLQKQLQEILTQKDFNRLGAFSESSAWSTLTNDERHLLGMLFVAKGENQLSMGDGKVLESFALASQVAADNPQVFYQQAVAYATQNNNIRCLTEACKALESATRLDPAFFDAWHAWGCILVHVGNLNGEMIHFQDANQKFLNALRCSQNAEQVKLGSLYSQWGLSWQSLGQLSGEAHDFTQALDKFRQATELGINDADFWNDYGNSISSLGILIGKNALFLEAIELFRKAIACVPEHFSAWLNLGRAFQRLFDSEPEERYFRCASESFGRAADIDSKNLNLWMLWGCLYLDSGKMKHDLDHLRISCQKLERANACESNHSEVLRFWAEAEMLCGTYLERLDVLRLSEEKILKSLELNPDSPDAWCVYGTILTELGRYFTDETYYEQSIEKFRYGLSLNSKHTRLWYGLSLAHYALGELTDEVKMFEDSARYCAKVIECSGSHVPQFWNDWGVALMKISELNDDQSALELGIEKLECAIGTKEIGEYLPHCELEWLYNYGCAFDFLGDLTENPRDYEKSIHVLSLVVKQDPSYTHARYNLALSLSHLAELTDDIDAFQKSLDHFQTLLGKDPEDENAWNDWGMTLLNYAQLVHDPLHPEKSLSYYEQAEEKFTHAVALGYSYAFYNMACLYSLIGNNTAAMHYIERTEASGSLPGIEDVMHDEWLEGLRETSEFRSFVALLSNRPQSQ